MADREKIVSAIEKAKKDSKEYAQDAILVPFKEADMIIAMLKEQEAVKPIKTWELNNLSMAIDIYLCGNCKEKIVGIGKYCSYCGKPVLWEGR